MDKRKGSTCAKQGKSKRDNLDIRGVPGEREDQ